MFCFVFVEGYLVDINTIMYYGGLIVLIIRNVLIITIKKGGFHFNYHFNYHYIITHIIPPIITLIITLIITIIVIKKQKKKRPVEGSNL